MAAPATAIAILRGKPTASDQRVKRRLSAAQPDGNGGVLAGWLFSSVNVLP